ncbi:MAG: efflux RND transporter permease subunit, partial [Desulfurellaceae bacterium]|nr:efflux RND transporter permease subunit [Desulfurellaceae bacterium]
MKLPDFSVKQPVATLMLFCAIILLGVVSLTKLNIDLLPDVEPPVVSILTTWPGASASDVESEVTEIIENQINSVNNLDTLTSKSLDNLSVISCKFDWGTNLDVATNDIRDKLELTKRNLPGDVDPPMLFKFSSATMPIMAITITGEKTWPRLYHLVDKKISDELKRVPGVGAIVIYGGLKRRINVYFDIKKLEGYSLSIQKVNQVLAQENLNIPAGSIKSGAREYFVRVPARYKTTDEIRNTIIGYYKSNPVYFRDVAEVEDAYKPEDLNAWADGKKSILLLLQKQTGKNTVAVVYGVKKRLAEIQKILPSDVKIEIPFDTAEYILLAIKNLRNTLLWGIFFVILVTTVFLRRFRTAIIISLTIPFSLIISFIFLYIFGYTINTISLLSLIIASGMVVDNSIVVLENIVRHREHGGKMKPSA